MGKAGPPKPEVKGTTILMSKKRARFIWRELTEQANMISQYDYNRTHSTLHWGQRQKFTTKTKINIENVS